MKKKTNDQVTRSFLKRELQKFATKEDLQRGLILIRKDVKDGDANLHEEIVVLEARIHLMVDNLKREIDEKNKQYRDEFLTAIDPILKEVLVAREDRTITTHRLVELQEKVEDHEERLRQLEPR